MPCSDVQQNYWVVRTAVIKIRKEQICHVVTLQYIGRDIKVKTCKKREENGKSNDIQIVLLPFNKKIIIKQV